MLILKEKAKQLFEEYCLAHTGRIIGWDYLSPKRQLVWMRDVYFIAQNLIDDLKKRIDPYALSEADTSWGNGYNAGITAERVKLIDALQNLEKDLEHQIEEFKERYELP